METAAFCLALLAMGLSIAFFWMTLKLSQRADSTLSDISGCVSTIRELFGTVHSEQFGLLEKAWDAQLADRDKVKEELAEIRKEADRKAAKRFEEATAEFGEELQKELNERERSPATTRSSIQRGSTGLLARYRSISMQAQAEAEANAVWGVIRRKWKKGEYPTIVAVSVKLPNIAAGRVVEQVRHLVKNGRVSMSGFTVRDRIRPPRPQSPLPEPDDPDEEVEARDV